MIDRQSCLGQRQRLQIGPFALVAGHRFVVAYLRRIERALLSHPMLGGRSHRRMSVPIEIAGQRFRRSLSAPETGPIVEGLERPADSVRVQ